MATQIISPPRVGVGAWLKAEWPVVAFGVALVVGVAARIAVGRGLPLWFDETFTATLATQPTLGALLRWCLTELTGPGFYLPMWLWAKVAGAGDVALRTPALLLSLAAPALIAWRGHADRDLRLFWATLALLWLPGIAVATEARAYPQIFFLGAVQAIAFLRLIDAPTRRRAVSWAAVSALAGLTHYHSLAIGGVQGLLYLAIHRRAALATWPAAFAFAPLAGWMAIHLPFLLAFAGQHGAAYPALPAITLILVPMLVFGNPLHGTIALGVMVATSLPIRLRWRGWSTEGALAASGLLAFALQFGLGFVQASFAARYLTPAIPALLFAVAWWMQAMARRDVRPVLLVLAALFLALRAAPDDDRLASRRHFGFEGASTWLAGAHPRRVALVWYSPTGRIAGAAQMADVGGFFFRRLGEGVAVIPTRAGRPIAPADAILWLADDPRHTTARPDRRGRSCRDFGGGQIVVVACRPLTLRLP